MVKYYDCDPERPICLYDFNLKTLMADQSVLSIKDSIDINWDYHYSSDFKDNPLDLSNQQAKIEA